MAFLRSLVHMLLDAGHGHSLGHHHAGGLAWRARQPLYWMAARWLRWAIDGARLMLGIQVRVSGMENLPDGARRARPSCWSSTSPRSRPS
jgi:1-acyl-sn-glycerol-3-phosphate acyltransferase